MSTDTGKPVATEITLTYEDDGDYWIARDEHSDVTAEGATRQAALEALDEAVGSETAIVPEVDPSDPFFSAPVFSSGRSDVSRTVDDHLADSTYRDKLAGDDSRDR